MSSIDATRAAGMAPRQPATKGPDEDAQAKRQVAAQFEAIFVRQLLAQASQTRFVEAEGGMGGEMFEGMMHGEVANSVANSGQGLGIARMLLESWGVEPDEAATPARDPGASGHEVFTRARVAVDGE